VTSHEEEQMGYTTDFIGHVDITPQLNDDEIAYLTAFSQSRRCRRPGGPYVVPGNPMAETSEGFEAHSYNEAADRQPGLWCDWVPCWDGCCLAYNGNEKFYSPVPWMRYLIAHFLKSGARASRTRDPQFRGFTFNHRLDGMIVGCRRDDRELFAIVVSDNRVREKTLRPADPRYVDLPPLPYEETIDRLNESRPRTRRRRDAEVIPLLRSV
jgi:hypothetical protein